MTLKLKPKQTALQKEVEREGLRNGQFEMFYMRPSQIWREYRRVYGDPVHVAHGISRRRKLEDLLETILLMWWTLGERCVFLICSQDERAWLRGNGTILLERNPWK